jgi:hypothetical protein
VEQLATIIAKELEEYSEAVEEKLESEIGKLAEDVKSMLSNHSEIPERTGDYKKGFFIKNEFKAKGKNKGFHKLRVANKKHQLTHLLEYGHVTRNGGRTRAYKHWIDGQKLADTLPERIKRVIEG